MMTWRDEFSSEGNNQLNTNITKMPYGVLDVPLPDFFDQSSYQMSKFLKRCALDIFELPITHVLESFKILGMFYAMIHDSAEVWVVENFVGVASIIYKTEYLLVELDYGRMIVHLFNRSVLFCAAETTRVKYRGLVLSSEIVTE